MPYVRDYVSDAPSREAVDALPGRTVLEFGTSWCGHCIAAQPAIARALEASPDVRHLKIEDGPGRALGRSFRVKLWPTLVLLDDGVERGRAVRPIHADDILQMFGSPPSKDGVFGRR